ncbi:hypothetical protein UJ101_02493 [Flavobacteriaceae bacterium UJ101]|nr:hypothetical protein UJ101_02493 [Flavobacteriaceae bacterium UJ101]
MKKLLLITVVGLFGLTVSKAQEFNMKELATKYNSEEFKKYRLYYEEDESKVKMYKTNGKLKEMNRPASFKNLIPYYYCNGLMLFINGLDIIYTNTVSGSKKTTEMLQIYFQDADEKYPTYLGYGKGSFKKNSVKYFEENEELSAKLSKGGKGYSFKKYKDLDVLAKNICLLN